MPGHGKLNRCLIIGAVSRQTRMPTTRAGRVDAPLASCQDILSLSRPQARCLSPLDLPLQRRVDEISLEFP